MKRKLLWTLLIAAFLLAGCNKKDPGTPPSLPDSSGQNDTAHTDNRPDYNADGSAHTSSDDPELSTLIGSYQGFLDQDTVEFEIDSNRITFQVYDRDIVTLLSEMNIGEEVTLAVEINEKTESRTIKSLITK